MVGQDLGQELWVCLVGFGGAGVPVRVCTYQPLTKVGPTAPPARTFAIASSVSPAAMKASSWVQGREHVRFNVRGWGTQGNSSEILSWSAGQGAGYFGRQADRARETKQPKLTVGAKMVTSAFMRLAPSLARFTAFSRSVKGRRAAPSRTNSMSATEWYTLPGGRRVEEFGRAAGGI